MIKLLLLDIDGTLTDAGFYVSSVKSEPHEYLRKFNTRDFVGINALEQEGIKVAAVTGSRAPCRSQFDRAAPCMDIYDGIFDKHAFVNETFIQSGQYEWDEIAFIGDELNDGKLLEAVGLAACPADSAEEVIRLVENRKDGLVTQATGGKGAVREFTDYIRMIYKIPARWGDYTYSSGENDE